MTTIDQQLAFIAAKEAQVELIREEAITDVINSFFPHIGLFNEHQARNLAPLIQWEAAKLVIAATHRDLSQLNTAALMAREVQSISASAVMDRWALAHQTQLF